MKVMYLLQYRGGEVADVIIFLTVINTPPSTIFFLWYYQQNYFFKLIVNCNYYIAAFIEVNWINMCIIAGEAGVN